MIGGWKKPHLAGQVGLDSAKRRIPGLADSPAGQMTFNSTA